MENYSGDLRERLARLEEAVKPIPIIRDRLHAIANSLAALTSDVEEAGTARGELTKKVDDLMARILDATITSARTESSLAATMAAHIEQCKTDKAEVKSLVARSARKQEDMHADNVKAQIEIQDRISRLAIKLSLYLGVAAGVGWVVTHVLEPTITAFLK